jgi:hypothetical protein
MSTSVHTLTSRTYAIYKHTNGHNGYDVQSWSEQTYVRTNVQVIIITYLLHNLHIFDTYIRTYREFIQSYIFHIRTYVHTLLQSTTFTILPFTYVHTSYDNVKNMAMRTFMLYLKYKHTYALYLTDVLYVHITYKVYIRNNFTVNQLNVYTYIERTCDI